MYQYEATCFPPCIKYVKYSEKQETTFRNSIYVHFCMSKKDCSVT